MPHLSVLLTRVSIPFGTFMLLASLQHSTCPAAFLAPTNGFLIRVVRLVVCETSLVPEISITFGAGDSDCREGARGARHTGTTGLGTAVCGINYARFVKCFTYVPLHHGIRQLCDHMIMSFDIIMQYVNAFGESTCPSNIMSSHARH